MIFVPPSLVKPINIIYSAIHPYKKSESIQQKQTKNSHFHSITSTSSHHHKLSTTPFFTSIMASERDAGEESFEDWEPVHFPAVKNPSSSSSAEPNEVETIADVQRINHQISINHEIVQIDQPSPTLVLRPPPARDDSGEEGGGSDADSGERGSSSDDDAPGGGNRLDILKSGIARVVETVRWCAVVGGKSRGLWSCVVVAAAVLMYAKLVRWRRWVREKTANHFVLLIKEKDEKIRRLMFQIARLNEMLIERRRVHVVRVPHYYRNAVF